MTLPEEGYLLRIFVGESDLHGAQALHEWLVLKAREMGLAGATVLCGLMGFGAHSRIHTFKIERLSQDLPMIVEIVDTRDKLERHLASVDHEIPEGLATLEELAVHFYRSRKGWQLDTGSGEHTIRLDLSESDEAHLRGYEPPGYRLIASAMPIWQRRFYWSWREMTDLLNEPQRSSLAVVLRMFEEELRQADAWLDGSLDEGTLYRRVLHLPPETRAAAREKIAIALAQIAELAQAFGLEPQEQDLAATIAAAMSLSWASLCDTRSDKLRRYGDVDPRLEQALDPHVEGLADLALSLASLLRSNGESS